MCFLHPRRAKSIPNMADQPNAKSASPAPPDDDDAPPPSQASNEFNTRLTGPFVPYRPFQPVMNAYYIYGFSADSAKTFKLCGENESDFLYRVEAHFTGFSRSGPLGSRPSIILHNGTSRKDPLLAAAGDPPAALSMIYGVNPSSIIMMPQMHPGPGATTSDLATEILLAVTVPTDKGVAFRFAIEVGTGKGDREQFEWRKIKDPVTKKGGYKLVRPSRERAGDSSAAGSSSQAASPSSAGDETLALLTWPKGWSWFKLAFTLEFKGSGLTGELGERWTLMAVITAIRLLVLRFGGKTAKWQIATAEKARGRRQARLSSHNGDAQLHAAAELHEVGELSGELLELVEAITGLM